MGQPLHDAAEEDRIEDIEALLRDNPDLDVNWEDGNGWAALHCASIKGHADVVQLLLGHSFIEVNARDNYGQTSFSFGCEFERVSVVQLLQKDPRVNVTLADNSERPPLWWASAKGHHKVIDCEQQGPRRPQ